MCKMLVYAFEMSTLRKSNRLFEFENISKQNNVDEKSIHIDGIEKYMRTLFRCSKNKIMILRTVFTLVISFLNKIAIKVFVSLQRKKNPFKSSWIFFLQPGTFLVEMHWIIGDHTCDQFARRQ